MVEHRAIADEVVAAADLCVWVTTAQRYADAVQWDVLRGARARGVPLLVVLNRVPDGAAEAVTRDLRRRLQEAAVVGDTAAVDVVTVPEQDGAGAQLPASLIAGFADAVAALGDTTRRTAVVETALRASLAHATEAGRDVAADVDGERADAEALRRPRTAPRPAGHAAGGRAAGRSRDPPRGAGAVAGLRRRGRDAAEPVRGRLTGAELGTAGLRRRPPGRDRPPRGHLRARRLLARHADRAATDAATVWELSPTAGPAGHPAGPAVARRPRHRRPGRGAARPLAGRAGRAGRVRGADRRRLARMASFGVNGTAAVLMLAVFAHRRPQRHEVGITAGAATVQQRILEHVFGTAAARSLVSGARDSLAAGVTAVLEQDRARFLALLRDHTAPPDHAARLRDAVAGVQAAPSQFLEGRRDG